MPTETLTLNNVNHWTCYQTQNRCYKRARSASPVGIVVHSTGAVNRNLRRYVDDPDRLGRNRYGNHWNKPSAAKCMHAFIGLDKNGELAAVQTLPWSTACWGCGKGRRGSYNYDPAAHIQFEICQGSSTDEVYYRSAIAAAEKLCAALCRRYGWGPEAICSHREAAMRGYASRHGDPERWMKHFGDTMDAFRARVAALLEEETADE